MVKKLWLHSMIWAVLFRCYLLKLIHVLCHHFLLIHVNVPDTAFLGTTMGQKRFKNMISYSGDFYKDNSRGFHYLWSVLMFAARGQGIMGNGEHGYYMFYVYLRSEAIRHLVYPLDTVLDDSIGSAVWFAAKGQGIMGNGEHAGKPYQSTARVFIN